MNKALAEFFLKLLLLMISAFPAPDKKIGQLASLLVAGQDVMKALNASCENLQAAFREMLGPGCPGKPNLSKDRITLL